MNNVTKDIKFVYDDWCLREGRDRSKICQNAPWNCDNVWMNHYLFPEVLLVADDWADEYVGESGERRGVPWPCAVHGESEDILRIMAEVGII